jgi:ribosomal protein S18 acetylase RimI-like enzyme
MVSASHSEPLSASVRTATLEDVEDLIPLYAGFMLHDGVQPPAADELRRRLARLLGSASDDVLIARDADGRAVGYLQQRYYYSVWRPDRDAYIEDVFVVEEVRGRRVGEALLQTALQRAREHGVARICLDTNERNLRARRLYERLGFRNLNREGGRQIFYSRLI